MKTPITYYNAIGNWNWYSLDPKSIFEDVKNEVEWEQRDKAPRLEAFLSKRTDPYTYGSGNFSRTYFPKPYGKYVKALDSVAETFSDCSYEACFLNYYKGPRDHLGWHSDDSDVIDENKPIVVISLGSEREIWFREKGSSEVEKISLKHGSILVMHAGMQQTHEHRIPKHGAECGERISLTFRGLK